MAIRAKQLGINLICVDNGWFGNLYNDKASLCDMAANRENFPFGLNGLSRELNALGVKLGLWLEPEMIPEDSKIAKLHPDWILKTHESNPHQFIRNQSSFVLDLSRQEIVDYLFGTLYELMSSANIDYIKWDMSRPLTDIYRLRDKSVGGYRLQVETGIPFDIWQSEHCHRYVLGLYELQSRLVSAFPNILFETCASGGSRFDGGMLYYSPLVWCSDNTDAISRLKIQYGTSILYPTSSIGSHVTAVPNRVTGNYTRARTRVFVAMNGRFGFQLDVNQLSKYDMYKYTEQVKIYKAVASIIHYGSLYRLWSPFQSSYSAFLYASRDKSEAVVFGFSMNCSHWNEAVPSLCLQGLDKDATYEVTEIMPNNIIQSPGNFRMTTTCSPRFQLGVPSKDFPANILINIGLPVKFFSLDDSVCFFLCKVDNEKIVDRRNLSSRKKINDLRHRWQSDWRDFYTTLYEYEFQ